MKRLRLAISPCPNDTAIFGALILGAVGCPVGDPEVLFEDVETLNDLAETGRAEVVKVSAAQAVRLRGRYRILSSGAAFGFGAGPKLVVRRGFDGWPGRVAVPGLKTTAALLLRAALAEKGLAAEFVPLRYDHIVPALARGRVDGGLLIHETALAHAAHGLDLLLDLGVWWRERLGRTPAPLGVILARTDLGPEALSAIDQTIRASLDFGQAHPERVAPLVWAMARETDREIISAHIAAYVGPLSRDMGESGRAALDELARLSAKSASLPGDPLPALDISW